MSSYTAIFTTILPSHNTSVESVNYTVLPSKIVKQYAQYIVVEILLAISRKTVNTYLNAHI